MFVTYEFYGSGQVIHTITTMIGESGPKYFNPRGPTLKLCVKKLKALKLIIHSLFYQKGEVSHKSDPKLLSCAKFFIAL